MAQPEISLILSCSSVPAQLQRYIDRVSETQPISKIELILVTWSGYDYLPLVTAPFNGKQQIHYDPQTGLNVARAKAVEKANGRIVVFFEDHAYVEGPWAETLIRLFDSGEYCAVGSTVRPDDETSIMSWAGYLVEYAPWGPGLKSGEQDHLPGHNCAYKRETLISLDSELPSLLRAESILHWRLRENGYKLYFTTDFLLIHQEFLSLSKLLIIHFWYGWNFADARYKAFNWSLLRRWFYSLAFPLIPVIRWQRLANLSKELTLPPNILWQCSPIITLTFLFASAGEALGYLFGAGKAPAKLGYMETAFDRQKV